MARLDLTNARNVPGPWFVDSRCIRCDAARHWAPQLIGMDEQGRSVLVRQPQTSDEVAQLWRAAVACPTQSIGTTEARRAPQPPFPYELTPGVLALGHNARASYGAHSYFMVRPDGNLMVDSPRLTRELAEQIEGLGGIRHVLLSHRDDIADADRWADRFGADVWIHEAEKDDVPYATVVIAGEEPTVVAESVTAVYAPGHTVGSVVYHVDDRWLFTGDTLHWNHRRGELDVLAGQTFQSWDILADTMDRLAALRVEWVFAGHGNWHDVGAEAYRGQMGRLGPAMRQLGRPGWEQRPDSAYDWI